MFEDAYFRLVTTLPLITETLQMDNSKLPDAERALQEGTFIRHFLSALGHNYRNIQVSRCSYWIVIVLNKAYVCIKISS